VLDPSVQVPATPLQRRVLSAWTASPMLSAAAAVLINKYRFAMVQSPGL
jgi:hypothetical protein